MERKIDQWYVTEQCKVPVQEENAWSKWKAFPPKLFDFAMLSEGMIIIQYGWAVDQKAHNEDVWRILPTAAK